VLLINKMKRILNTNMCKMACGLLLFIINSFCCIFPNLNIVCFVFSAILLVFVFICYDIQYAVVLSSILMVVDIFSKLNYPISLPFLICLIFVLVYAIKYFRDVCQKKQYVYWSLIIIGVGIVLQGFINFNIDNFEVIISDICMLAVIYLVFVYANKIKIRTSSLNFIYGFIAILCFSVLFVLIPSTRDSVVLGNDRFMAFCTNPNLLQIFCILGLSFLMCLYFKKDMTFTQFICLALPLSIAGIFTKSKAFILLFLLLIIIFIFLMFRKDRKKGLIAIGLFVMSMLIAYMFWGDLFRQIFKRFFMYSYDNIWDKLLTGRVSIWKKYLNHWTSDIVSIFFGVGIASTPVIDGITHSAYIAILYYRGVLGVLLISIFVIRMLYLVTNKKTRATFANTFSIAIYLFLALEENVLNFRYLFMLILSCLFIFSTKDKSKENKNKIDRYFDLLHCIIISLFKRKPKVISSKETLDYIIANKCSIGRYGDGEILLTTGHSLSFQEYDEDLSQKLKNIKNTENFLVCIPNVFDKRYFNKEVLKDEEFKFWSRDKLKHGYLWKEYFNKECFCGDAFLSRFYIRYKNPENISKYINKLKKLWNKRNVIIVEGESSQVGIGNDLLKNAKNIKRIVCPNVNAYSCYDRILKSVEKNVKKNDLVLIALGPTATVLAYDLSFKGIQALDMGHFDIEYECFLLSVDEKVPVKNKHVNECKFLGESSVDKIYLSQIIEKIK